MLDFTGSPADYVPERLKISTFVKLIIVNTIPNSRQYIDCASDGLWQLSVYNR